MAANLRAALVYKTAVPVISRKLQYLHVLVDLDIHLLGFPPLADTTLVCLGKSMQKSCVVP